MVGLGCGLTASAPSRVGAKTPPIGLPAASTQGEAPPLRLQAAASSGLVFRLGTKHTSAGDAFPDREVMSWPGVCDRMVSQGNTNNKLGAKTDSSRTSRTPF